MLNQIDPGIGSAHRCGHLAFGCGKIVEAMHPAQTGQRVDHILGDFARIKAVATELRDPTQHFCLTGGAKDLAGFWHCAIHQIGFAAARIEDRRVIGPVECDP